MKVFICVLSLASYVSAGFLGGSMPALSGYSYSAPQPAPVYSAPAPVAVHNDFSGFLQSLDALPSPNPVQIFHEGTPEAASFNSPDSPPDVAKILLGNASSRQAAQMVTKLIKIMDNQEYGQSQQFQRSHGEAPAQVIKVILQEPISNSGYSRGLSSGWSAPSGSWS